MATPLNQPTDEPVFRPDDTDDEIDLTHIVSTLWRGKWIIAASAFACLVAAADQVYRVEVPFYSATSSLVLDADRQASIVVSDFDPGLTVDWYTLGTQSRILNSRHLAEKVVLNAGLLDDPYFNPYAKVTDESRVIEYKTGFFDLPTVAMNWARRIVASIQSAASDGVADDTPDQVSDEVILQITARNALSAISVSNDNETYVYDITATTPFPDTSAKLATAWARAYVQDQREVKINETRRATTWLGSQAAELKTQLEASEAELARFSANIDLISADSLESRNQQLKLTRERLERERNTTQTLTVQIDALRVALAEDDFDRLASVVNENALAATANDATPLEELVGKRVQSLLRDLEAERRVSEQRQIALARAITELEATVAAQSTELVRYEQMSREVEANKVIYEFFLNQLREVSLQAETLQPDSRVLSDAIMPESPVSPRKTRAMALALILGSILGAGFVLLREYLNTRFRTAVELAESTGYTVLGMIPQIQVSDRRKFLEYLKENRLSRIAEGFRNLRTSLLLSNVDQPPRTVMVTSSKAGEGKSTVSVALAGSMAGLDKRVLLVECDIRRRTFSEFFGDKKDAGLISLLSGQAELEECIYHDPELNLDILFADTPSINSVDLFSSVRFKTFLQEMSEIYDMVILDTPPIMLVSDARVIAPLVDARLFVAQWNKTSIKVVQDGLRSLEEINARATGLVMTQISLQAMKSYAYKAGDYYDTESGYYYQES